MTDWIKGHTMWNFIMLCIRGILITIGVFTLFAVGLYELSLTNPVPETQAVLHLNEVELQHRIDLCNEATDQMAPDSSSLSVAAFHCSLMWQQTKKIQAYLGIKHITPDAEAKRLFVESVRAGLRYTEYESAAASLEDQSR